MANEFRELLAERKARLVSDTDAALLPDRTIVREFDNIPTGMQDECRDYLDTKTSVINGNTTQEFVVNPYADNVKRVGTWRGTDVDIVPVSGSAKSTKFWKIRQTLKLGFYTAAAVTASGLPDPVKRSYKDVELSPFSSDDIEVNDIIYEYRNLDRDGVASIKDTASIAVGASDTLVTDYTVVNSESEMYGDGAASIFVILRKRTLLSLPTGDPPNYKAGGDLVGVTTPHKDITYTRRFRSLDRGDAFTLLAALEGESRTVSVRVQEGQNDMADVYWVYTKKPEDYEEYRKRRYESREVTYVKSGGLLTNVEHYLNIREAEVTVSYKHFDSIGAANTYVGNLSLGVRDQAEAQKLRDGAAMVVHTNTTSDTIVTGGSVFLYDEAKKAF